MAFTLLFVILIASSRVTKAVCKQKQIKVPKQMEKLNKFQHCIIIQPYWLPFPNILDSFPIELLHNHQCHSPKKISGNTKALNLRNPGHLAFTFYAITTICFSPKGKDTVSSQLR